LRACLIPGRPHSPAIEEVVVLGEPIVTDNLSYLLLGLILGSLAFAIVAALWCLLPKTSTSTKHPNGPSTSAPLYDAHEVARLLGIELDKEDLAKFPNSPRARYGYVTFFDPGWSILRLSVAVAGRGTIFSPQDWYDDELFAKFEEQPRYRQLRMDAFPESFGKTFSEQQALVPAGEEIPTARVVLIGLIIHFLVTGMRLFPDCYVRCSDQTSGGHRVFVGDFDSVGFRVDRCWDDDHGDDLGLASSRKF
jgi:hypothetical protein